MMEDKNIIMILIVLIVILLIVGGVMFFQTSHEKEPTKIKITSNDTQYEGGKLSILLTDLNKTGISKENVNITVTNDSGKVVVNKTVKTDSLGNADLELDLKKGKYDVNVTYSGNENYTGSNATQKLTIEEEVVEQPVYQQSTQSSSSSDNLHYDAEINVYYNDDGIIVDPDGHHSQAAGSSYSEARDARDRWERGEPVMV